MRHFAKPGYRDYWAQHVSDAFRSGGPAPVTIPFVPYGAKVGTWHGLRRQTNLDLSLGPFTC